MEWFVIEGSKLPEWLRSLFVDEHGEVYFPCGAVGNERIIMLCMVADGVRIVRSEGHLYAPVSWLTREYPRYTAVFAAAAARAREAWLGSSAVAVGGIATSAHGGVPLAPTNQGTPVAPARDVGERGAPGANLRQGSRAARRRRRSNVKMGKLA
jgi:hypothetical protein